MRTTRLDDWVDRMMWYQDRGVARIHHIEAHALDKMVIDMLQMGIDQGSSQGLADVITTQSEVISR